MLATRRNLLLGSAGAAAFASMGQLSGCSSTTPGTQVLPAVIDAITKAITNICSVIPGVTTLVQIVVTVFPAAAGVATIASALAQQIATYVCGLFKKAGIEHGDGNLMGGSFKATVGDNNKEVELHGYTVAGGKLIAF